MTGLTATASSVLQRVVKKNNTQAIAPNVKSSGAAAAGAKNDGSTSSANASGRGGANDDKFMRPHVTTTMMRPLPRTMHPGDIYVCVRDEFDQQSKDRGDDFLLASKIASDLEGLLFLMIRQTPHRRTSSSSIHTSSLRSSSMTSSSTSSFAPSKETAQLVFEIHVTAASLGSRWSRCFSGGSTSSSSNAGNKKKNKRGPATNKNNDTAAAIASNNNGNNAVGFVRLGLDFSMYDPTKSDKPIYKYGKIGYVNPLNQSNLKDRCGRNSGEHCLFSIVPVIAQQLLQELPIELATGTAAAATATSTTRRRSSSSSFFTASSGEMA